MVRYIITERKDHRNPSNDDPKAQAMARHSAVYDLRDTKAGNVVVSSAGGAIGLRALRNMQGRHNTEEVLG